VSRAAQFLFPPNHRTIHTLVSDNPGKTKVTFIFEKTMRNQQLKTASKQLPEPDISFSKHLACWEERPHKTSIV
jgi:hypothetical protein